MVWSIQACWEMTTDDSFTTSTDADADEDFERLFDECLVCVCVRVSEWVFPRMCLLVVKWFFKPYE